MTELQQQNIKTQWQHAGIALAAVIAFVLFVFYGTVETLVMTWWDKPEYNHCLLILPIIAYLINERREIFQKIAPKGNWLGLVPVLGGGMLWLLGDLADANVVRQFGLLILIQGCLLTILGDRVVRAMIFPIFYMVFLIPFGDFLVPALQDSTLGFIIVALDLIGIPVFVEGLYLSIPAGDFHVAEACAGLRFLVATVALGTLMANVAYKTVGRQITVVILAFIVPIVANWFRASGIILIAHWSDMKYATGVDHLTFGWIFFAIVLLIFISIAMTFTNRGLNDGYIDFSKKYWSANDPVVKRHFVVFFAVVIVIAGIAPVYVAFINQRLQSFENYFVQLDGKNWGQDVSDSVGWKPSYQGASQTFHQKQELEGSEAIDIFVAYYKYQNDDIEMIRHGNDVIPADYWGLVKNKNVNITMNGLPVSINEELILSNRERRLVWYWYWIDGQVITSRYQAKLFDAKAKLLGGRLDSAVIALSIIVDENNLDQKREQLSRMAASLPLFETTVSTKE